MEPVLERAAQTASSFNFQFFVYLIMGTVIGWVLTTTYRATEDFVSLILVGVSGAWLGAEGARLFGQAEEGSAHQFAAALIGSFALAAAWRRFHPTPETLQTDSPARR